MAVTRSLLSFTLAVIVLLDLTFTSVSCLPYPMPSNGDQTTTIQVPPNTMVTRSSYEIRISLSNMSPQQAGNDPATRSNWQEIVAQGEGEKRIGHLNIQLDVIFARVDSPNLIVAVLAWFSQAFLHKGKAALPEKIYRSSQLVLNSADVYQRAEKPLQSSNSSQSEEKPSGKGSRIDKICIGTVFGLLGVTILTRIWVWRRQKRGSILRAETLRRLAAGVFLHASDLTHALALPSPNVNKGSAREINCESQVNSTTITRQSSPIDEFSAQEETMSFSSHEHLKPPLPMITLSPVPGSFSPPPSRQKGSSIHDSTIQGGTHSREDQQHSETTVVLFSAPSRRRAIRTL